MAAAFHRDGCLHTIHAAWFTSLSMQACIDEAWPYHIDADSLLRNFAREADGESLNSAFGGRIVDILAWGAAREEMFTMEPPNPPCRTDIRRTASRAHRKLPNTLVAKIRGTRDLWSSGASGFPTLRRCSPEPWGRQVGRPWLQTAARHPIRRLQLPVWRWRGLLHFVSRSRLHLRGPVRGCSSR